jgi:cytochrome c
LCSVILAGIPVGAQRDGRLDRGRTTMIKRLAIAAALASVTTGVAVAQSPEATAGRSSFQAACAVCHGVKPGERRLGPSLAGIVGRPAGATPGFVYSPAMAKSGIKWDEASLNAFLTAPQKSVPGTRMIYAGMADAAKRKALIAYLRTLPAK